MRIKGHLVQGLTRTPLHLLVIGIALVWMIPTVGLFVSSLRTRQAINTGGWWIAFQHPLEFTLENYVDVLTQESLWRSFLNSLAIAIPATVIPIVIAALAAYAFAWMRFPGRDLLFLVTVGLLVVPLQMTLIPVLRLLTALQLTGTFPAVWLAHTAYGLPFAIFLLRNFFGALPRDLFEAAYLDGASDFKVFFRIVLPLSVPALAALAIFQFMWVWNDLLVALVYLSDVPDRAPMTLTIVNLVGRFASYQHLLTSAAFLSMLLPLLIFFALQRYFVEGILAGSVKG
ncbi:MAG: carbohydrate ABC transporter permease [Dehalococcoidia bacterium]